MNWTGAQILLQTMIDYFEAGNKETDRAAKAIIEWDFENQALWQQEISNLRETGEWTRIRAPEADIVARGLRRIQQELGSQQT